MSATIEKEKRHASDLHFEHVLWIGEIGFYKDQLALFRKRLEEIAGKYSRIEVLSELEHFQNQFIVQAEQIDIILHNLKLHEGVLVQNAKELPVAFDHRLFSDHKDMRLQVEDFTRIFRELRNEFLGFLAKYM